ncbi:hypothetical protein EV643_11690 [Kribbella sp. VKM Ac-2527]|uniref:Uncharacterized protein n=1 Tax=Kribbella caucasensis TaxID=2512215 RepID=A0A4R6K4W0_9ACTN|nr:hypothetical protein EV643_11690 [Kribbella sp. VKM Ac-2527]
MRPSESTSRTRRRRRGAVCEAPDRRWPRWAKKSSSGSPRHPCRDGTQHRTPSMTMSGSATGAMAQSAAPASDRQLDYEGPATVWDRRPLVDGREFRLKVRAPPGAISLTESGTDVRCVVNTNPWRNQVRVGRRAVLRSAASARLGLGRLTPLWTGDAGGKAVVVGRGRCRCRGRLGCAWRRHSGAPDRDFWRAQSVSHSVCTVCSVCSVAKCQYDAGHRGVV